MCLNCDNLDDEAYQEMLDRERKEEVKHQVIMVECPICQDEFEKDQMVGIPSCEHRFCKECLDHYLSNKIVSNVIENIPCS